MDGLDGVDFEAEEDRSAQWLTVPPGAGAGSVAVAVRVGLSVTLALMDGGGLVGWSALGEPLRQYRLSLGPFVDIRISQNDVSSSAPAPARSATD